MDKATLAALDILAGRLKEIRGGRMDSVVNLSPVQSAGYIILLRTGYHLQTDPILKMQTLTLMALVGERSGLVAPNGSSVDLVHGTS